MRSTKRISRAGWAFLAALGVCAAVAPTASADTTLPVWTCRASAGYVELDPLLNAQRIEPVLANGFPDRDDPDRELCASADSGVQNVDLPPAGPAAPLISLEAASASTDLDPDIAAARDQTVAADGGVAETVRIEIPGLVIDAESVTAQADASCVSGAPVMTGSSTIVSLSVNGTPITIPQGGAPVDLNLAPLIRVRLNQQVTEGNATSPDQALTQRAVHVELLSLVPGAEPVARVVLGEAKVDRRGAVCAPAPPPPTCPAGSVPQAGSNPLVCVLTVTAPCPAGSTPDNSGACVIVQTVTTPPPACPAGTTRDPASQACILLVQRPCPAGATADPATQVCVVQPVTVVGSGENGRVGSSEGPRATCGRLDMFFVRGGFRSVGRSFTSRFGTRTVTRGRLVTCGSNPRPIIGARIDVVHVLPNGQRRRKTGLRSRANGRLTLILPIDLRSRRIEYAYRPDLRSSRVTSRVTLRLTVRNRRGQILR
jgi:hypothetical protein